MLYEGVLLFGVLMAASAAYIAARPLLQQAGLDRPYVDQAWMFVVLGIYFCWFWQRNGQTLAMQTWREKLGDQQEVLLHAADMIMDTFATESAMLS